MSSKAVLDLQKAFISHKDLFSFGSSSRVVMSYSTIQNMVLIPHSLLGHLCVIQIINILFYNNADQIYLHISTHFLTDTQPGLLHGLLCCFGGMPFASVKNREK